jgi:hypothetical protein
MISTQRVRIFRSVNSDVETMSSGLSTSRTGKPNDLVLRQQTSRDCLRLNIRLNGSKLFTLFRDLWASLVDCCGALSPFMVYFNRKIFSKISVMDNLEAPCAKNFSAASRSTLYPFSFPHGRMI